MTVSRSHITPTNNTRWQAIEQARHVVERDGRHLPVPSRENPDKAVALAALVLLQNLAEAAERVGLADNPTLAEFPWSEAGDNALREMTSALEQLAAALAAVRAGAGHEQAGDA